MHYVLQLLSCAVGNQKLLIRLSIELQTFSPYQQLISFFTAWLWGSEIQNSLFIAAGKMDVTIILLQLWNMKFAIISAFFLAISVGISVSCAAFEASTFCYFFKNFLKRYMLKIKKLFAFYIVVLFLIY